jgi:hypothetical protein
MINENFLIAAVAIKRKGISLDMDLQTSENRLKKTKEFLEEVEIRARRFDEDIKKKRKELRKEDKVEAIIRSKINEFLQIVKSIEDEKESIDKFVEEREKIKEQLLLEEHELYRMIKNKHADIEDKEIAECIRKRFEEEGLL